MRTHGTAMKSLGTKDTQRFADEIKQDPLKEIAQSYRRTPLAIKPSSCGQISTHYGYLIILFSAHERLREKQKSNYHSS